MSQPSPAGPPETYHHGHLRRALIDTALVLLTEEGAWNFTLRELARRAGVSHAALYNHFVDKAALLAEVAARGFEALRQVLDSAARRHPRSPRRQLVAVAGAYVRFGLARPAHYRLMFGPDLADRRRHPALARAGDAAFAVLVATLRRGQAAGEIRGGSVRDHAVAAWSLVHGLTMLFIDGRLAVLGAARQGAARLSRAAAEGLVEGLRASPG
jgi:AcrR family transcriptional regulator